MIAHLYRPHKLNILKASELTAGPEMSLNKKGIIKFPPNYKGKNEADIS